METLIAELRSTPRAQGHDEIFYPGEIEARSEERLRAGGIVPPGTIADLVRLADELGSRPELPFH